MKTKEFIEELNSKTVAELNNDLVEAKKELFNLRFQNATNQLSNTSRITLVRKNIARIQTVFTEKAVKVKREEPQKEKAPVKKMSYKDQREYDTIGDEIAALEEKIAKTDADMAACATDFTHLQELSAEKEALEAKLEERMERWMELSELAEEIERNKA